MDVRQKLALLLLLLLQLLPTERVVVAVLPTRQRRQMNAVVTILRSISERRVAMM
jgi:hypothetical protein